MIGLSLIEARLAGQTSRLDEALLRLRSLVHALEDVSDGVVMLADDSAAIAQALVSAILLEIATLEDVRSQLVLTRYLLKVRGPGSRGIE